MNVDSFEPGSFEAAFASRLRAELDAMRVWLPAATPAPRRARSAALASAAAFAVGCALLLGTVAAFASGSPNPKVWISEAEKSIGIPPGGSEPSSGAEPIWTPTPEPSDSPPAQPVRGEPESAAPSAPERESPHPESPAAAQPPDPAEHSPTSSPGDG
jgi:hypothetical protein